MSESSTTALAARGLGFAYRDGHGIAEIDLDLAAGEVVGVLGPNGAGKSTLVKALSGTVGPCRGSVTLAGEAVASVNPDRVFLIVRVP